MRNRSVVPQLVLIAAVLVATASTARAADAVVVEVYQNCRLSDTNVIISEGVLTPQENAEVKARVAAAGKDPRTAVPRLVQILKDYGVADVEISRQGSERCEPVTSGKFVEAVGTYCGPDLRHAEVLVDRTSFYTGSGPDLSFERFLKDSVKRLRAQDIYDRPVVSIQNAPDCE